MPARKMTRPPRKNPPPPKALAALADSFVPDEIEWDLFIDIVEDGIVFAFDQETEFLLMTARGARKLAAKLIEKAEELEKKLKP